jgi:hypothetical protein
MHMRINETRHDVGPWGLTGGQLTASYLDDFFALDYQFAIEYFATNNVNNVSFDVNHSF